MRHRSMLCGMKIAETCRIRDFNSSAIEHAVVLCQSLAVYKQCHFLGKRYSPFAHRVFCRYVVYPKGECR